MSKLFKFKELSYHLRSCAPLSNIFSEDVSEADILRLGLDGHLKLSVDFVNHAKAKKGHIIPIAEAKTVTMNISGKEVSWERGIRLGATEIIEIESYVYTVKGIFDLAMFGGERGQVEGYYQALTNGPEVAVIYVDGCFVVDMEGTLFQLQEQFPRKEQSDDDCYYPTGGLPEDCALVVRTAAIREFENHIEATEADREHVKRGQNSNTSERLSYLNQASTKFWGNADKEDRTTHPDTAAVVTWFEGRGFSAALARSAATIIRPEWAPLGRKPDE